jgi:hypothetical protein
MLFGYHGNHKVEWDGWDDNKSVAGTLPGIGIYTLGGMLLVITCNNMNN